MKITRLILFLLMAAGLGLFVGRLTAPRLSSEKAGTDADTARDYTCSMHPQIRQPKPGKCPICAMDLIPVGSQEPGGPREVTLTPHARALARITTTQVERRIPVAEIRLFGRVEPDESRVRSLSARFPARIEKLYVNYTGLRVQAGDHLASIYSPELITAQSELLGARRFNDARALQSAREKLRLWGFRDVVIDALEQQETPTDTLDMDAPLGGFVTEKRVAEGDYVDTGSVMFRIADLTAVWVILDAYEIDKPWLRFGQPVTFTAEALPGHTFEGRIAFVPPVLDPVSRTFKIRLNVDNPDLKLRPGMFITGIVQARFAGSGVQADPSLQDKWISPMHPEIVKDHPGTCDVCGMDLVPANELGYVSGIEEEPPVVVPATAVLRTGRRAIVYVEVPDRDNPTYEGRQILLGPRAGEEYVVVSGLDSGERVVTNGAFKLDSALQLHAKPSMMSPPDPELPPELETTSAMQHAVGLLIEGYLPLWQALADDDLDEARIVVDSLTSQISQLDLPPGPENTQRLFQEQTNALRNALVAFQEAATIRNARRAFEDASMSLIRLVRALGVPDDKPIRLAYCPMAFGGRRADWLQTGETLLNPYFGDAMLHCGEFERLLHPPPRKPSPTEPARAEQHSHP